MRNQRPQKPSRTEYHSNQVNFAFSCAILDPPFCVCALFTRYVNGSWYCSFIPGEFRVLVRRFESRWGIQSGFPRHFSLSTGEWGLRPEACIGKRRGEIGGSKSEEGRQWVVSTRGSKPNRKSRGKMLHFPIARRRYCRYTCLPSDRYTVTSSAAGSCGNNCASMLQVVGLSRVSENESEGRQV